MFDYFDEDGSPKVFSGMNGSMVKATGRQLAKASTKAVKHGLKAVISVVPFKAIFVLLSVIAIILLLNMVYFYSTCDEVKDFFTGLDGGNYQGNTSDNIFESIKSALSSLLDTNTVPAGDNPYSHTDPRLIRKCMDMESDSIKGYEKDKKIKAKVVTRTTVITREGITPPETDVKTDTGYVDYDLNLYDAVYLYRLWWQLPASIAIYLDLQEEETDDILKKVREHLFPQFIWAKEGEYTKDVTEYTETVVEAYEGKISDGLHVKVNQPVMTGSTITIIEKTTYYPLPFLKSAVTPFKTYMFNYKQDVVKSDEKTDYKTQTGSISTSVKASTEYWSYTITKVRTGMKVVEDIPVYTDTEANPEFIRFMDAVPISINDLGLSAVLAGELPGSGEYLKSINEFLDQNGAVSFDPEADTGFGYDLDMSGITLGANYPSADSKEWLSGDVDVNPVFAGRLAALARNYGRVINITSGYRSIAEQQAILNDWYDKHPRETGETPEEYEERRRKWVADPGKSRHQFGLAADVEGWARMLTNEELEPFGLYKPMYGYKGRWNENWHIEPVETKGKE